MSIFKHNCKTDGHRFVARYDEKPNPEVKNYRMEGLDAHSLRRMLILNIYIHDICEYCGKTEHKKTQ